MTQIEQIITEIERLKREIPYHENAWSALDKVLDFINSLPKDQPSEGLDVEINLEYKSNYKLKELSLDEFRNIIYYFTQWQKERDIKKACEWLKMCVDVDDEVKMVDGEPEVHSFIQKIRHRTEVANQIIEDFKKFMDE